MFLQVFVKAFGMLPIGGILAYHLPPVFPNIMDYHGDREAFCRLCLTVFDIFYDLLYFFIRKNFYKRYKRHIVNNTVLQFHLFVQHPSRKETPFIETIQDHALPKKSFSAKCSLQLAQKRRNMK